MVSNATTKLPSTNCPEHNDLLRVYCETCNKVICRDCTIISEHKTHDYSLIDECYPKHQQQIEQTNIDLVKHKMADINTMVTQLDTTEKEVIEQGDQIQEQINTHAQQMINQVQSSSQQLSQQLHNIVKQKTQLLTAQKQQAQLLHTQLNTCQEMIDHSLKEWTKQQILTEKHTLINQMNTATQHVDPTVFQSIEKANMKFTKTGLTENGIGFITSTTYGKATFDVLPCLAKRPSTGTLALHSQDGSPFPLHHSLISSTLSSPGNSHFVKCDITQTHQEGKYNITFTPSTRQDQLIVQVGGVDIPDSPLSFTLPVIPTPEMRGKPINTMIGLSNPWGIAVCDNGDIIVAECFANRITILNMNGERVKSFGTKGTKEGQFTFPRGVAIASDGHILVTDEHRLQKLTTDAVCVKSVGRRDSGSGQLRFCNPRGITVHPTTGQIFIADSLNKRIQVFNNDLTFSHTITQWFTYSFDHPFDVALDNEGYLYLAEFRNHSVTKLTTKGKYITRFGSSGSAPGQLSYPISLTINNGLVYVSEWGNNRVSIFDTNGKFLHCFGKRGRKEGEFMKPRGITIDTLGNLFVCDTCNKRIVVY